MVNHVLNSSSESLSYARVQNFQSGALSTTTQLPNIVCELSSVNNANVTPATCVGLAEVLSLPTPANASPPRPSVHFSNVPNSQTLDQTPKVTIIAQPKSLASELRSMRSDRGALNVDNVGSCDSMCSPKIQLEIAAITAMCGCFVAVFNPFSGSGALLATTVGSSMVACCGFLEALNAIVHAED